MSFESLGLMAELRRAVSEKGYTTPTPIQQKAIPLILEGRDLMGGAQTGTGKTAGFTLPILQRIATDNKSAGNHRAIRALVLTPTRELAAQVMESVHTYGRYLPLKSTVVHGGVKIQPQVQKLRRGVDVLVATPGRLLDHIQQNTVDLSKVDMLVLDEADRMLDMGFINDMRKIFARLPKQKQTLLFSATFSGNIKKLADSLMNSPALVEVATQNAASERVEQTVCLVDKKRKRELLAFMIGSNNWKQVLVFSRTKHGSDRLVKQLGSDGITADAIHGNKSQGARSRALANFKDGRTRVLVATDIAARGIDISSLPHVINFDLPNQAEDYVHRIGRTGRAGNEGEAISLVCADDYISLKNIEKLINRKIPRVIIEGFEVKEQYCEVASEKLAKSNRRNSVSKPNGTQKKKPGAGKRSRRRNPSRPAEQHNQRSSGIPRDYR
jgi:ATP-dependent RNA helicase RhlE